MNEQVKSLANIWANRRSEDDQLGIVYTFTEPALEQFAKLVVKECLDVIGKERRARLDKADLVEADIMQKSAIAIIKHFEFKEN